jgi:hypothetical protein
VPNESGFPLDLPDIDDPQSLDAWQRRIVDLLDFTVTQGAVTADATPATLVSLALQQFTAYLIESWVLGVLNQTTGNGVPGSTLLNVFRGGFYLDGSNNAQIIGGSTSKEYSGVNLGQSSEPWSASLTTSGGSVVQQVTGDTGDVVLWRCRIKIFTAEL